MPSRKTAWLVLLPLCVALGAMFLAHHGRAPAADVVAEPTHDSEANSGEDSLAHVSVGRLRYPVLPAVNEATYPAVRLFSGAVHDRNGPLVPGWILIHGEDKKGVIEEKLSKGRFSFRLASDDFRNERARVTISDGTASIFSGIVTIREGVNIYVSSTRESAIRGKIVVVNATLARSIHE